MLEFPTVVVVAKGAEVILARWEVVERPNVRVKKPVVGMKNGANGGGGDGGEVKVEERSESEKGVDEAESEIEGNPPPDTTTLTPGDSKAAPCSTAGLPDTSAANISQTAAIESINALVDQASHQPSPALPPP